MTPTAAEGVPVDLLVAGATLVATVDDDRTEIAGGWVAIDDGLVVAVGRPGSEPAARERLDARGHLVTPGLINAHHHLWQNLTRSYAPMTTTDFLGWLGALYPLWSQIDAEGIYLSTRVGLAELALGGCTTTSDHLYLQPPGQPSFLDVEIEAAAASGLRFHATRGCVDRGQRVGSPMPDHMTESVEAVLADCERLVATHHQRGPSAMVQVALGPHSVFGASADLMAEVADLAKRLDVRLHTHLSGDRSDDAYCLEPPRVPSGRVDGVPRLDQRPHLGGPLLPSRCRGGGTAGGGRSRRRPLRDGRTPHGGRRGARAGAAGRGGPGRARRGRVVELGLGLDVARGAHGDDRQPVPLGSGRLQRAGCPRAGDARWGVVPRTRR